MPTVGLEHFNGLRIQHGVVDLQNPCQVAPVQYWKAMNRAHCLRKSRSQDLIGLICQVGLPILEFLKARLPTQPYFED
jgi:hypothetical protein